MIDNNRHLFHMDLALGQAKEALKSEEVPIGAVVVSEEGEVLSLAHNRSESLGCQTGHAELLAITEACKKIDGWRLDGCSIYVTLEPCLMCFGLITLSRMKAVYFGASSPLFGCGLDNPNSFPLYKSALTIEGGLREEKSISLLRLFFKKRREKGKSDEG